MASYSEISVSTLSRLVGTPDCPLLIDVRTDEDFNADPTLIPSAYRHPFAKVADLADTLNEQAVVVYCQKGHKISHGASAVLRAAGVRAEILERGHFGWRDAGYGR